MELITPVKNRIEGFTRGDLVVLVSTIILVVIGLGLCLPAQTGHRKSSGITCLNHLKQVGLAFRMWSNDHGQKFPFDVSIDQGGSLEFIETGDVFPHFRAVSNELNSPKCLFCPLDKKRKPSPDFATFRNQNLSYFVGLDA